MSKNILLKKILEKKKKNTTILDKVLFVILALGFAMMLAFFAYLLWFTLTNRSVIYFLPAEKTVAYFELEDMSLPPKFSQEKLFNLVGVSTILDKAFGLDVKELQDHFTQGRLGFSLVKDGNDENKLLLFFRTRSKSTTLKYFENLGLKNEELSIIGEKKNVIYSYPQSRSFAFSFIGSYLFISEDLDTLKLVQSVHQGLENSLNEDLNYQKSLANLPRQVWGRGYINIQSLNFGGDKMVNQLINPLKNLLNHFALTIRKQQNGFHFNTMLSINPELLSLNKGYTDSTRFTYSLSDFIGAKNLSTYIGGSNLSDEWENTLETISHLNPAYGIILEGVLRAQLSKIFGDNVSLRNDIYPLFDGEYAFVLENLAVANEDDNSKNSNKLGVKLILMHSDINFAKTKLEKLFNGFKLLSTQFAPKLKVFELPDGTESKELVADPTRMKETKETYNDYEINCLNITDSLYGFCYTVTNKLIVLSNDSNSIKETIDLSTSPKFVLSQSQSFRQALNNLSAVSDEITYVSLDNTNVLLKNNKFGLGLITKNILGSFEAMTWIKHYFNDGVSTEGFLLLK